MESKDAGLTLLSELFSTTNNGGTYVDLSDANKSVLSRGSYYATT